MDICFYWTTQSTHQRHSDDIFHSSNHHLFALHTHTGPSLQSWVWTHEVWFVLLWGRLCHTGLVLQTVDPETLRPQHLHVDETLLGSWEDWSCDSRYKGSGATCQVWWRTSIPVWCCGSPLPDRRSVSHWLQMFLLRRQRGKVRSRQRDNFKVHLEMFVWRV